MATCGNCKAENQTVEHVRACYSGKFEQVKTMEVTGFGKKYAESRDFQPMALNDSVPDSMYALKEPNGLYFYRVRTGKGKWEGFQFVDRLIGHPGDWLKTPVKGANRKAVLNLIGQDPKESALLFSREFTVCAVCNSPLSDPVSMELGFGPICIKRF